MSYVEPRQHLRTILQGSQCVSPASVYDALSARVAESIGFKLGLLSGSTVASNTLAAPDIQVHTLTECSDLIRRIMRVSRLSLFLDAETGYGNALNVMRTIAECEHAGVSGISIQDTVGPLTFGQCADQQSMISIEEGVGKMRAAVAARNDPSMVIAARTPALKLEGIESALTRVKAYAATGVDAIFVALGAEKIEHVRAIYETAKLPLILGWGSGTLLHKELASCGGRILLQMVQPVGAAVKSLKEIYTHLFQGGSPDDLKSKIATADEMAKLVKAGDYKDSISKYLQ